MIGSSLSKLLLFVAWACGSEEAGDVDALGSSLMEDGRLVGNPATYAALRSMKDSPRRAELAGFAAFALGEYNASASWFSRALKGKNDPALQRNAKMATSWAETELLVERAAAGFEVKVELVTTLYRGRYSAARFEELSSTLRANVANRFVASVHVFAEGDVDPRDHVSDVSKLVVVRPPKGVPSWGDLLRYGLTLKGVVLVAHADILLDESVKYAGRLAAAGAFLAVTRQPHESCLWESGGGHAHRIPVDLCSGPAGKPLHAGVLGYDAFAFQGSIPESVLVGADGLRLNRLGSDLVLVELAADAGLAVVDPCVLVRATHRHCYGERGYDFNDDLVRQEDILNGRYTRAVRLAAPKLLKMHNDRRPLKLILRCFPHSGEDWVRAVLEGAGLLTGTSVFDAELAAAGFLSEGRCSGVDVIVSHAPSVREVDSLECARVLEEASTRTLELVRDPFDVIAEAFLRDKLSHRRALRGGSVSEAAGNIETADPAWRAFALEHAAKWAAHYDSASSKLVRFGDLASGNVAQSLGLGGKTADVAKAAWGVFDGYAETPAYDGGLREAVLAVVGPTACRHNLLPDKHCGVLGAILQVKNRGRLAIYGVSERLNVARYWVTFGSMACAQKEADLFLFLVDGGANSETPPSLRLNYVVALNKQGTAEWLHKATTWANAPGLFYLAGYGHALYVNGDVIAAPAFDCSSISRELSFDGVLLGAPESSLGTFLGAVGGADQTNIEVQTLLWVDIVNTGVLFFDCAAAFHQKFAEKFNKLAHEDLLGDMHALGLVTLSEPSLLSRTRLPLAWNYRFDKSRARLDPNTLSFAYGPDDLEGAVRLARFSWYNPWDATDDVLRRSLGQWWRFCNATMMEEQGHRINMARECSSQKCVLAYSLYGADERYIAGAIVNARLLDTLYVNWAMRVYHDSTVPSETLRELSLLGVELIDITNKLPAALARNGRLWRFLVCSDPAVDRYAIRDVDSVVSPREEAAVAEWVVSRRSFHVMRDHPSHSIYARAGYAVQAGMWGGTRGAVPEMRRILESHAPAEDYHADARFLRDAIRPLMLQRGLLEHDSFSCVDFQDSRPFPTSREGTDHVGAVIINGQIRPDDHLAVAQTSPPPQCLKEAGRGRRYDEL